MNSLGQVGADDRRAVIHSIRVGVAASLGSLLCFIPSSFGRTVLWASVTVALVLRYTVEYFQVVESGDENSDEEDALSEVYKSLLKSINPTEKPSASLAPSKPTHGPSRLEYPRKHHLKIGAMQTFNGCLNFEIREVLNIIYPLYSLRAHLETRCMSISAESAKVLCESIETMARIPNAELTLDGSTTVPEDLRNSLQAQPELLVEANDMRCGQIFREEQSSEPSETFGAPKSDQRPCHVSREGGMQAGERKWQHQLREIKQVDFCFPAVLPLALFASLVSESVVVSVDELGKQAKFKTMDEKQQTAKLFMSSQTLPTPTKPPPPQKIPPSPTASKSLILISSTVLVQIAKPEKIETTEENGRRAK